MKKTIKGIILSLVLLALSVALCACGGDKTGDGSSITIGIPQDLDSLDPHLNEAAGTKEILFNVYEGLVKADKDGELNPAVASAVTPSEDGKVYTVTLRDNVKFHDGSTVTAEDVKFSLERAADDSIASYYASWFTNVDSIEINDDKTLTITLKEADTDFLFNLTAPIMPAKNEDPSKNVIGTGPYKFVSWTPQEEIVLVKNDDYWGTPANITNVTIKIIADGDTIVTNLNGGSIDFFARLTTAQVDQLSDDFDVYEGTMNLVQALYLNNDVEPFNDPKVRQALCYATDRQGVLDLAFDGKGTIISSSMFPAFGKYYMEELNDVYPYDEAKAKELLAEAGYPNGFSFTITVPSNYQPHVDTAQVLSDQYKKIGIDAKIKLVEWDTWLSDVYTDRKFESTVIGVDAPSMTASALLSRFESSAHNNFINFNSPEYDEVYNKALATSDDKTRTEGFKECEKILTNEAANVYIQDMASFVAINKKFGGYEFYPIYVQDLSKLYVK